MNPPIAPVTPNPPRYLIKSRRVGSLCLKRLMSIIAPIFTPKVPHPIAKSVLCKTSLGLNTISRLGIMGKTALDLSEEINILFYPKFPPLKILGTNQSGVGAPSVSGEEEPTYSAIGFSSGDDCSVLILVG